MENSPIFHSLLGGLFTWGLTALGSLCCLLHHTHIPKGLLLDGSLGFSAGVMIAASFWSLLAPAIEISGSALTEDYKQFAFIPSAIGLILGAAFVYYADKYFPMTDFVQIPHQLNSSNSMNTSSNKKFSNDERSETHLVLNYGTDQQAYKRKGQSSSYPDNKSFGYSNDIQLTRRGYHKIMLMILAITVHNIPEGLAVGVGFGAVGSSKKGTFDNARNLALGIGIQNFPEGLAVSLPLKASGFSTLKSIWYGQLSGIVEPFAALFGCALVQIAEPLLPYALAFAAGAMIFVVFDSIVPESNERGNGKIASVMVIVGFVVMMSLDVGLG